MPDPRPAAAAAAPLRVLHLEDSARDADIVRHKLEADGLSCETVLTGTRQGFEAALAGAAFDLVLIDYSIPGYDGLRALELARATQPDVPVILISGKIGEEEAVKCLHLGATDYLLKVHLERLGPAVRRAIAEAANRRIQQQVQAALIESEARKAAILESVLDCIVTVDADGIVLEFNAAATHTFGYARDEAIGRPLVDLIIPARFADPQHAGLAHYLSTGEGPLIGKMVEMVARRADGSEVPVELSITAIRSGPARIFTGVIRDITARRQAEAARAQLAAIVDASDDGIFRVALDDTILSCNAGAARLYGYAAPAELIGRSHALLVPADKRSEQLSMMEKAARGQSGEPLETQRLRKDGSRVDVSLVVSPMPDSSGGVGSVSTIARNISGRKRAEAELQMLSERIELHRVREDQLARDVAVKMAHFAQYDRLTDLPNRTLFDDRMTQAIVLARRERSRVAVLFVDVDRFKQVNDSLGHAIGDGLLQSVTARLLASVRASDTVSRYGGDEFVVLLGQLHRPEDAAVAAEKIVRAMAAPHEIAGHVLRVTASVGISVYPDDGAEAAGLISAADVAMYHAKESGRNKSQFFTTEMNARRLARQTLENDLHHALLNDELTLHYQPKINLATARMTGVEALVRWQHPIRGLVSPEHFVPVAEESGLILQVGGWVLREACRQARAWQIAGLRPMPVAVNVSALEFRNPSFLANAAGVLRETELEPRYLELEVTESVLMKQVESTTAALHALKALGVELAIDDFGTGYSSLSYLSRFPIDTLKIDRSFVRDMAAEAHNAVIIEAVIGMGRSLDLRVVAEGVETLEQVALLRRLSCAEGQGFYFSRPVPADRFTELLRRDAALGAA